MEAADSVKRWHVNDDPLTHRLIGAAIEVHRLLGPGLLESTYEECLCLELSLLDIPFEPPGTAADRLQIDDAPSGVQA